jgi:hypothetical protein
MTSPMPLDDVLTWCLIHFVHEDEANAAMHTADVRYSPITFRVAEQLADHGEIDHPLVAAVMGAKGAYAEDTGR